MREDVKVKIGLSLLGACAYGAYCACIWFLDLTPKEMINYISDYNHQIEEKGE